MTNQAFGLRTHREHALGITLSLLVTQIWMGSSQVIQYVFGSMDLQNPYAFTNITTCFFSTMALRFLRRSCRERIYPLSAREKDDYASVAFCAVGRQFNVRDTNASLLHNMFRS